jgi:hypothetical protein
VATDARLNDVLQTLDPCKIMGGVKLGREIYGAKRTVEALQRAGNNTKAVVLQRAIAAAAAASEVMVARIPVLQREVLNAYLKDLKEANAEFPAAVQLALYKRSLTDMLYKAFADNDDFTGVVNFICPPDGPQEHFDPMNPTLMAVRADGETKAKELSSTLQDSLISWLKQQETGTDNVLKFAAAVVDIGACPSGPSDIKNLVEDLKTLSRCLLALLHPSPGYRGSSSSDGERSSGG